MEGGVSSERARWWCVFSGERGLLLPNPLILVYSRILATQDARHRYDHDQINRGEEDITTVHVGVAACNTGLDLVHVAAVVVLGQWWGSGGVLVIV